MAFSIRMTEEERQLAESYSKLHSLSLAEAFKSALFEKIEDEFDITNKTQNRETYEDESSEKEKELEKINKL